MLQAKFAKSLYLICCICLLQTKTIGQELTTTDTMKLGLVQVEKIFLEKNLELLAAHYNIEGTQALVIQARKWDNPNLITDQNVYRKGEGWFKHGSHLDSAGNEIPEGQYYVQVQQLIKTAGKRGKQINLARTNVSIAEWQFKST